MTDTEKCGDVFEDDEFGKLVCELERGHPKRHEAHGTPEQDRIALARERARYRPYDDLMNIWGNEPRIFTWPQERKP